MYAAAHRRLRNSSQESFFPVFVSSLSQRGPDELRCLLMQERIEPGYQVFTRDGGEEIGAVRFAPSADRGTIVIYVENAGDFEVPLDAVEAVHSQKVILNYARLDPLLKHAIRHAHDAEDPNV
jgi:hypothetical protein